MQDMKSKSLPHICPIVCVLRCISSFFHITADFLFVGRMKSLMEDVNKMQSELKSCQSNMDTISKKATGEM